MIVALLLTRAAMLKCSTFGEWNTWNTLIMQISDYQKHRGVQLLLLKHPEKQAACIQ